MLPCSMEQASLHPGAENHGLQPTVTPWQPVGRPGTSLSHAHGATSGGSGWHCQGSSTTWRAAGSGAWGCGHSLALWPVGWWELHPWPAVAYAALGTVRKRQLLLPRQKEGSQPLTCLGGGAAPGECTRVRGLEGASKAVAGGLCPPCSGAGGCCEQSRGQHRAVEKPVCCLEAVFPGQEHKQGTQAVGREGLA